MAGQFDDADGPGGSAGEEFQSPFWRAFLRLERARLGLPPLSQREEDEWFRRQEWREREDTVPRKEGE